MEPASVGVLSPKDWATRVEPGRPQDSHSKAPDPSEGFPAPGTAPPLVSLIVLFQISS